MIASERHSCHKDILELFSLFEICYTSWVYKATSTSLLRDLILEAGVRLLSLHKSWETHNFGKGRCLCVVSFWWVCGSCLTGVPGTILQNKLNPLFLISSHPHFYCDKLQSLFNSFLINKFPNTPLLMLPLNYRQLNILGPLWWFWEQFTPQAGFLGTLKATELTHPRPSSPLP